MLKITARRHADYCARHQITYWALAGDVQFCRSPHWNKIALIQRALQQGFDTVGWLDADTLVIRESEDIRGALLPGAPLGMTIHPSPGLPGNNHFNTGVMVMRNTPETRAFFDAVWEQGPVANHSWHEQARILDLLEKFPGLVQALDPRWNATHGLDPVEVPIIKAWHGAGASAFLGIYHELEQLGALDPEARELASSVLHPDNAARHARAFIDATPLYPEERFAGRGIVIGGGGLGYFTCAWICIGQLRRLGCRLPIQLWHLGTRELDDRMRALVAPLGVECIDACKTGLVERHDGLAAWELKPHAILHSSFREVLWLDSDNVPVVNPEFLFDTKEFAETGAIFWPDRERMPREHPAWQIFDVPFRDEPDFESGQVVVDKEKCWRPLRLALWYNEHSDFFYEYVYGDKDTFRFAWHRLKQPFAMPSFPLLELEGACCQHDFSGRIVFQHRSGDKWSFYRDNPRMAGFQFERECLADLRRLRSIWDGRIAMLR
jgi:hypothetical protein